VIQTSAAAVRRPSLTRRARGWVANPWGQPRLVATATWLYIAWSLAPVATAILFSFNAGRSRAVWQGFSLRWYLDDPYLSLAHDPSMRTALAQSLRLAAFDIVISVPLGVALALGLARWRGLGSRPANLLILLPLVTPELVLAVALLLDFSKLFRFIPLGTPAQLIGQVTISLSYVVVVVRGRLAALGRQYEEAGMDLGAGPLATLRYVMIPLLLPAIVASVMVVFAVSIDDFVVTQYLSSGVGSQTIPIDVYTFARGNPTPELNALASLMVYISVLALGIGYAVFRYLTRHERGTRAVVTLGGG
jgi:spermidine/putrescine transport system permease protein